MNRPFRQTTTAILALVRHSRAGAAAGGTGTPPQPDRAALPIARAVGAIALIVTGGVHLEQYTAAHFSVIPTIGSLFLLNFIAATTLGLILLIPIRATAGPRRLMLDSFAAVAGLGVAGGALVALLVSEHTPLFGFMEHGYRTEIVIALAAEIVTIVSLGVFLACARIRLHRLHSIKAVSDDAARPTGAPRAGQA